MKAIIDGKKVSLQVASRRRSGRMDHVQINELNDKGVPVKAHNFSFMPRPGMKFYTSGQHYEFLK